MIQKIRIVKLINDYSVGLVALRHFVIEFLNLDTPPQPLVLIIKDSDPDMVQ